MKGRRAPVLWWKVACRGQGGGRKPLAGRKIPKETQAHRQWPQALMGEAELRAIIRNKKRKHHERQTERMEKKQRQWSKRSQGEKKKKKVSREKRTGGNQTDNERPGREWRGRRWERVILTKETGGGARRKSFPHQHVLFQKSSKLCWNESERIIESQLARERREREGVRIWECSRK